MWLTLGQRTLRYEAYVMPAPEENVGAGLRACCCAATRGWSAPTSRSASRTRCSCAASCPSSALTEAELDRVIGSLYATVEQSFPACCASASPAASPERRIVARDFRFGRARRPAPVRAGRMAARGSRSATDRPVRARAIAGVRPARSVAARCRHRLAVIVGGGNMGAALLGGLLAGAVRRPRSSRWSRSLAARRDELTDACSPASPSSADVPPCDGRGDRRQAARRRRRRRPRRSPPAPRGCCRSPPACPIADARGGRRRRRRRGAGDAQHAGAGRQGRGGDRRRRRRRPTTTSTGPRGSSARSAPSCASPSASSTPSPGSPARGPAYLFLVAEALIDAGVLAGLPRPTGRGAGRPSCSSARPRCSPSAAIRRALRAMVTSPGGTTAAGLRVLEAHGVRAALVEAVHGGDRAQPRARHADVTGREHA